MAAAAATIVPGAVAPATAARWLAAIEPAYAAARLDPSCAGFDRHSSSLRVGSLPAFDLGAALAEVFRGRVAALCRNVLGASIGCAVDHCWVRRQYPEQCRPPGHAAHRWHQDGALAFDFLHGDPAGALLPMTTCWIALTPCGRDAPGIEWAGDAGTALLPVASLAEEAVAATHGERERHRPILAAGDALVFGPGLLHRTHVDAAMSRERTSVELRFLDVGRLPARLRGTPIVTLH